MNDQDSVLKELEISLKSAAERLKDDFRAIRGNRPSVELVENLKANYYDQKLEIKQLGSLSVKPPREIEIQVWDKNAVAPVVKAIEEARIGLSASSDGGSVRVSLPSLTDERRRELSKLAGKTAEAIRIQIRSMRDDAMKKLKTAEESGGLGEDALFKSKEKAQKMVDETNQKIEKELEGKIKEIEE